MGRSGFDNGQKDVRGVVGIEVYAIGSYDGLFIPTGGFAFIGEALIDGRRFRNLIKRPPCLFAVGR